MSSHRCICGRVWYDPDADCHEECGICGDITPADDIDKDGLCAYCAEAWAAQVAAEEAEEQREEAELAELEDCPECGTPLIDGKCPAPARH